MYIQQLYKFNPKLIKRSGCPQGIELDICHYYVFDDNNDTLILVYVAIKFVLFQ